MLSEVFERTCGSVMRPELVRAMGEAFKQKSPSEVLRIVTKLVADHEPVGLCLTTPADTLGGVVSEARLDADQAYCALNRTCLNMVHAMDDENPHPHDIAARVVDALILSKTKASDVHTPDNQSYCMIGKMIIEDLEELLDGAEAFEREPEGAQANV